MDDDFSKEKNPAGGAAGLGVTWILLGGASIGIAAAGGLFEKSEALGAIGAAADAGGAGGIGMAITALTAGMAAGGVAIAAGGLAVAGGLVKSKPLAVFGMALAFLAGAIQITAGVLYMGINADAELAVTAGGYEPSQMTERATVFNDLGIAVFNRCCYQEYKQNPAALLDAFTRDSIQSLIQNCADQTVEECVNLIPPQVKNVLDNLPGGDFAGKLCTCHGSDFYDKIADYVNANGVCETLSKAAIPVDDDLKIPTISLTVAEALDFAPEYKPYLPIKEVKIVGMPAPREDFTSGSLHCSKYENSSSVCQGQFGVACTGSPLQCPVGTPASESAEGFSCGLGYAKGVTWYTSEYLKMDLVVYGFIGCGALLVIMSTLLVCLWSMSSSDENEWLDAENGGQVAAADSKF